MVQKIFLLLASIVLVTVLSSQTDSNQNTVFDQIRQYKPPENFPNKINTSVPKNKFWNYRYNILKYDETTLDTSTINLLKKNNEGYSNLILGDYYLENAKLQNLDSLAYDYYIKALNIADNDQNNILKCEVLKRILQYHFKNEQNHDVFEYYALQYRDIAYDDFERISANYYWMGVLLAKMAYKIQPETNFISVAESTLEMAKNSSNTFFVGRINQLMGVYYDIIRPDMERAAEYYNQALEQYSSIVWAYAQKNKNDLLFNIGAMYVESDQHQKAIPYFKRLNISLISKADFKDKVLIYDNLFQAYNTLEKKDSAIYFLNRKYEVSDSLGIHEKGSTIAELETKYQTAEKEKQLLEEQRRSERRQNWLIAAAVVLILGSSITILLHKNTSKKRLLAEKESIINKQKLDNLVKDQELMSIDAMIAGQEKERQKVANELHDDLGSLMATIKLHFDQTKSREKNAALNQAQNLLDEAYKKIRGMAHTKNSGVMSDQGLLPAVQKMAEVISRANQLEISVEHYGMGERMENSLELTIFRIIQELTTNILKHAEATTANIQLTQHEENLNIIIADNGVGFNFTDAKNKNGGMGLDSIEKRIEHLEGNFTIDSVIGKGTSILIDIPV